MAAAEEEALLGEDSVGRLDYKYREEKSSRSFKSSVSFLATSLACGVGFSLVLFTIVFGVPSFRASTREYLFGAELTPAITTETALSTVTETYYPPPPVPTLNSHGILEKDLTELREMVDRTNGYYARDWSLGLGWNNMRYIIEAAVLQARLLNRTLVLPSHIYARSCEYDIKVCEKHAKMINKNDAIHTDQWRKLPLDQQMSWYIPLEVMIDIPRLRAKHPILLMTEYLLLQGLDPKRETTNGWWDRSYYHQGEEQPDFYFIPNKAYEPDGVVRVDTISHLGRRDLVDDLDDPNEVDESNATNVTDTTDSMNSTASIDSTTSTNSTAPINSTETATPVDAISLMTLEWSQRLDSKLHQLLLEERKLVLDWTEAKIVMTDVMMVTNETLVEIALEKAGWVVVHTFEGNLNMDFTKTVIKPMKQVARRASVRGFVEDFKNIRAKVLLIEGEVHLYRKPGFLRFTTEEGRDSLGRIVLQDIHVTERVTNLAHKVIKRMDDLNGGRSWMAAHMRRGDFISEGWAMAQSIGEHYNRIMSRLHPARRIMEQLANLPPRTYNVPDVQVNRELAEKEPPKLGDFIYIATDERGPEELNFLRTRGIRLFEDLVTEDDRREFGWPLLYSDVIALVEQNIIGQGAGYFYAHALSSVAGGIMNIRAASGNDPRTALVD